MVFRAAVFSAVLLSLSAAALCHGDLSLGDIVRNLTAETLHNANRSTEYQMIRSDLGAIQSQLTVLQAQLTAAAACPAGWSHHGNRCYLIPSVTATWFGASVLCATIDSRARLASVHADNQHVVEELVAASGVSEVWAGGVRLRHSGVDWGWQDGTPYDFANWAPGSSATNTGEDCIIMRGPKSGYNAKVGQWHDGFCCHPGSHFNFMCQITLH